MSSTNSTATTEQDDAYYENLIDTSILEFEDGSLEPNVGDIDPFPHAQGFVLLPDGQIFSFDEFPFEGRISWKDPEALEFRFGHPHSAEAAQEVFEAYRADFGRIIAGEDEDEVRDIIYRTGEAFAELEDQEWAALGGEALQEQWDIDAQTALSVHGDATNTRLDLDGGYGTFSLTDQTSGVSVGSGEVEGTAADVDVWIANAVDQLAEWVADRAGQDALEAEWAAEATAGKASKALA